MIHLYIYPVEIGEKVTSQPSRHDVTNARFMKNSTTCRKNRSRYVKLDVYTFPAIYYLSIGILVSFNPLNNVNFQISSSTNTVNWELRLSP